MGTFGVKLSAATKRRMSLAHTTHGQSHTKEYNLYQQAKSRCQCKRTRDYPSYGGRGIKFKFESFDQFLSVVGRRPTSRHSLDRKNNDGHYETGNVRWSTQRQQLKNRRVFKSIQKYTDAELMAELKRRKL